MANKLLKKIVGALDYKLVEKNLIKNNRLVNSKSILNLNLILKKIFDSQKIECLIQIGANDGNSFDELNKFIKEYRIKSILVEPINEYFEDLKLNYKNFKNVYFENSAITVGAKEKEIFSVNNNNLKDYDEHIKGINSFDKNHLIKHGVKSNNKAWEILANNGTALDAVEQGVMVAEADPKVTLYKSISHRRKHHPVPPFE